MKLRKLVTIAAACAFIFGATFGTYALNMEKTLQEISAASYDSINSADYADQVAALVNSERAAYGLNPVKVSPKLSEAATARAYEIQQSFSHTRPNGTSCFTAITELGITYSAAAENIAYGQKNPESVMKAWMNSSGHRANILNSSVEYIGVGAVYNNGVWYWTQFFAASKSLSSGSYLPGGNYETELPAETTVSETKPKPAETTAPEAAKPEPAETSAPEASKPEPEVTTTPEASEPEPEVTTAPEAANPKPEVTTKPETKPEPETTTAPETKPQPETTTSPEIPSQPQQTEAAPEIPCVTDCSSPENCYDDNGFISCTPETPCNTGCNTNESCPPAGNQNSADCNTSGNCPTTGNQNSTDCNTSGNCPPAGNQNSAGCNTSGNCPTTGNQNSSSCPQNSMNGIQDILSAITGSSGSNSGSCNNNSGNCFNDVFSWIGGNCNSSGNPSGNCNNNSNSSNSCNNGNSFVFGTQSSSGCPLTDILGSMFR